MYWIFANKPFYNLASDVCGETNNLNSQGLIADGKVHTFNLLDRRRACMYVQFHFISLGKMVEAQHPPIFDL